MTSVQKWWRTKIFDADQKNWGLSDMAGMRMAKSKFALSTDAQWAEFFEIERLLPTGDLKKPKYKEVALSRQRKTSVRAVAFFLDPSLVSYAAAFWDVTQCSPKKRLRRRQPSFQTKRSPHTSRDYNHILLLQKLNIFSTSQRMSLLILRPGILRAVKKE